MMEVRVDLARKPLRLAASPLRLAHRPRCTEHARLRVFQPDAARARRCFERRKSWSSRGGSTARSTSGSPYGGRSPLPCGSSNRIGMDPGGSSGRPSWRASSRTADGTISRRSPRTRRTETRSIERRGRSAPRRGGPHSPGARRQAEASPALHRVPSAPGSNGRRGDCEPAFSVAGAGGLGVGGRQRGTRPRLMVPADSFSVARPREEASKQRSVTGSASVR